MESDEGRIEAEQGYKIWYRRVGEGGIPLLTLHGGPGAGHDYLESLAGLASGRPVIFYDQLGCGKSDKPDDPSLWQIDRFVAEVDTVRQALGLGRIHLLGQSWGGWLAIEYMMTHPTGIVSLTLASTSSSIPQFVAEAGRLVSELPSESGQAIQDGLATGDYNSDVFEAAVGEFYSRHLIRMAETPVSVQRTTANLDGNQVYATMNGPNEFTVIGNLKDWDRTDRLGEITVPTLITVGRYDEITPACAKTLHGGIPNSRMVVFEDSAHLAHVEEAEKYLQVLGDFLTSVEQQKQG